MLCLKDGMFKIILSAILITVFILADGSVLQTGQVKSYDADGYVVTDGSIKDDGYYQIGLSRSYSRTGDVVTDNTTGLEWQDDTEAGSVTRPWVTQDNYDYGDYCNTSGWTAVGYCTALTLDDGGWRLPSMNELGTLVDSSEYNPSTTENIFNHIQYLNYWSSDTTVCYRRLAWVERYNYGIWLGRSILETHYVRCVRGESLVSSDFSRNDETEIVQDNISGLQWQDDSAVGATYRSWTDSIDYCENTLILGGYADWRMPNKNELLSIVDYNRFEPIINSVFQNTGLSFSYWSSTTYTSNGYDNAWIVNFDSGGTSGPGKNSNNYVRCVRGCLDGYHLRQGEGICIPGTPASDPGEYPLISDRNYLQGNINIEGNRTEDPGYTDPYPPLCPPGQMQVQQGAGCVVNPECTDADSDTYFAEEGCGTAVDCDDANSNVNPGASESCDDIDNDCDGETDEGCPP